MEMTRESAFAELEEIAKKLNLDLKDIKVFERFMEIHKSLEGELGKEIFDFYLDGIAYYYKTIDGKPYKKYKLEDEWEHMQD